MIVANLERQALVMTAVGNFFLSLLGIGFSLFVNSDSILLDAFFNVISLVMSLGTLWIAWLLRQPENRWFQFGYVGFVPLTNIIKGLLIALVSLFAGITAIEAILRGGQSANSTLAMIYAIIASVSCLATAFYQFQVNRTVNSLLLRVDAANWFINGLISLSVGLTFGLVLVISDTPLAGFAPFADPVLVLILVIVAIPVPIKTILGSIHQLLLGAPHPQTQAQLQFLLAPVVENSPHKKVWLRSAQVGDMIYLHFYWLIDSKINGFQVT
jgi:predicted Co/Zn/Cd cation transporter (cation efflux family)